MTTCRHGIKLHPKPDFTIKLEYFTWHVHSSVFSKRSGFFKAICQGGEWQESKECSVTLRDDDPWAFARLVQFMYYGNYQLGLDYENRKLASIDKLLESGSDHQSYGADRSLRRSQLHQCETAIFHLQVYDLADKYDIPGLRLTCTSNLGLDSASSHAISAIFSQYYPDRMNLDENLKVAMAKFTAHRFEYVQDDPDEWENGVGRWMTDDWDFCVAVMEQLAKRYPSSYYKVSDSRRREKKQTHLQAGLQNTQERSS